MERDDGVECIFLFMIGAIRINWPSYRQTRATSHYDQLYVEKRREEKNHSERSKPAPSKHVHSKATEARRKTRDLVCQRSPSLRRLDAKLKRAAGPLPLCAGCCPAVNSVRRLLMKTLT